MPKQLIFQDEARRSLKHGADTVATAVKTTLGPRGRNVALGKPYGAPTVTHDGVTVALQIELPDPFANMGARLLIEAASKTNDVAGDGTTTATVLAQAILAEGHKVIAAGANPMLLKRGLDKGAAAVLAELQHLAIPVRDHADIAHIAGISAGDNAIGDLIAEVIDRVGKDGVITVEESNGMNLETTYTEGMQIDRGYISPHFVTHTERMEAVLDAPYILITNQKISLAHDLVPVLEEVLNAGSRELVIIADDVDGEALSTLVINKLRGTINVVAIKAPSFGDRRQAMLEDIAILTGATLISEQIGRTFASVGLEDLGVARRVIATKDTTTFIEGKGDKQALQARMNQLRVQVETTTSDFDSEKLHERLAKLSGCVAVINVGAATQTELNERKQRVEDALNATRAAIAEGIVPGGGVALVNALDVLEEVQTSNDDERFGVQILKRALEEPLRQLANNAGEEGPVIIATIRRTQKEQGNTSYGYNVMSGMYDSMIDMGVIDPVNVTRSAVQNAVSVAGLLLTIEVLIADETDDAPPSGTHS